MLRWPGDERDPSGRLQYAAHLGDSDLRTRREHVAELTDHDVEGGLGVRECLGVTFLPRDLWMPRNPGIFTSLYKKFRRQVKRADPRPRSRGCHRDNAGTGAHIEHRLASPDAGKADEMSRDGCREGGRRRERGPGLALLALEIHEGIVAHGTSR